MKQENQFLVLMCIFLLCLGYFGWFTAELDNKQLRKEIISIKYKALSEVSVSDLHTYTNN